MKASILWIEGKRADSPSFVPVIRKKEYAVETVPTGNEALEKIAGLDPDLVVVNAASFRSNGKRICRSIRDKFPKLPIILIIQNNQSSGNESCANVVLTLPFTARKLINRITPFTSTDKANLLCAGDLRLNLDRNQVSCPGKNARLTPRLAHLLQILMQHPGEVLKREQLFSEVWKTQYIEDTRTLDVHISWLRQAIEEDPRQPKYIKTIRRVGYRLDVDG